jgi:hypothetical protein
MIFAGRKGSALAQPFRHYSMILPRIDNAAPLTPAQLMNNVVPVTPIQCSLKDDKG